MTDPYDTLMDHLAALAVEAVQCAETAVQSYWLAVAARREVLTSSWTLEMLLQQAQTEPDLALPEWARGLAPQALACVLYQRRWLETPASPTPHQGLTYAELVRDTQAVLRWRDEYRPYLSDIRDTTSRLWHTVCCLYGPRPAALAALAEEVLRGVMLFEAGLYFACHEYFETLWGRTADTASDFYQGLIQVAVAMRHLESHNIRGASILLRAGVGRLQRYPAVYKGLHLAAWLRRLKTLLEYLETLPGPTAYQFDRMQVPPLISLE
jgi:predicted metal-dependent hydrolase